MIDRGKQEDILRYFENDLSAAKSTHSQIWSLVMEWTDLFEGSQGKTTASKSGVGTSTRLGMNMYPQRDIMRVVEGSLPDITAPFLTNEEIVDIQPKEAGMTATAEAMTKLINKQFKKGIDTIEFIETIGRNIQVEGTTFVKVGWGDDMPTAENIQFSELLLDPSARRMKDLRFAIQRSKVSIADIKANPAWYGEHSDEKLSELQGAGANEYDDYRNIGYGRDDSFNFDDEAREMIELFEYYGVYDLNGDGTLVPVLGIWSGNTILRLTESPYPASWNGIPFECAVYTRRPFNIYGESIAEMLKSSQSFRQSISTAIANNMANSTAGQKFFLKGAMDQVNFRRMLAGERHIYLNKPPGESFAEGTFTDLPQSVFAVNDMLKNEQDQLSGISEMSQGMDPRSLNSGVSATAVSITNTNAQKRLLQITRHISEMLERVFAKWIDLNQMMLQNGVVRAGAEDVPLSGVMLGGKYEVNIVAGTAGIRQSKIQNLQMMISMTSGTVSPAVTNKMLSDLADLLDMPGLSEVIQEEAQQEPDPMQEQIQEHAMQLEFAEKQADIDETHSKSQLNRAKSMSEFVDTERASYGLS